MLRIAVALVFLTGCGFVAETVGDGDADGVVYQCVKPDATKLEYCALLSADELGAAVGGMCERTDRWWPALTNALGAGCLYSCEPHEGCNAKSGCYCP